MTDAKGWPDPARPGVPLNPERRGAHWLRRKSGGLEAWSWDPDADGCGTEYSGAWQEADGDGQPDDMARWMLYLGPCLTPAEHAAALAEARREGMREAAGMLEQMRLDHNTAMIGHWHTPDTALAYSAGAATILAAAKEPKP